MSENVPGAENQQEILKKEVRLLLEDTYNGVDRIQRKYPVVTDHWTDEELVGVKDILEKLQPFIKK